MNGELIVEIVTQSGVQYQGPVDGVVAPGVLGYLGVRPGHAPLLTSLAVGVVTLHMPTCDLYAAVSGGIMEVLDNRVTVLADAAEMAEQIDIERARRAVRRAQERLTGTYEDREIGAVDVDRAHTALLRALNRLRVVEKTHIVE